MEDGRDLECFKVKEKEPAEWWLLKSCTREKGDDKGALEDNEIYGEVKGKHKKRKEEDVFGSDGDGN